MTKNQTIFTFSLRTSPFTRILRVVLPLRKALILSFFAVRFEVIFAYFVFLYLFLTEAALPIILIVFALPRFILSELLLSLGEETTLTEILRELFPILRIIKAKPFFKAVTLPFELTFTTLLFVEVKLTFLFLGFE